MRIEAVKIARNLMPVPERYAGLEGLGYTIAECNRPTVWDQLNPFFTFGCESLRSDCKAVPNGPGCALPMPVAPAAPQTQEDMTSGNWTPEQAAAIAAAQTRDRIITYMGNQPSTPVSTPGSGEPSWCGIVPFSSFLSSDCAAGVSTPQVLMLMLGGIVVFSIIQGRLGR